MGRGIARGVLALLLLLGVVAATFSAWSAAYRYDVHEMSSGVRPEPLAIFIDTAGDTRAFRGAEFGAPSIDISETTSGDLLLKVSQQISVTEKNYQRGAHSLRLHIRAAITSVIPAQPQDASVTRRNTVFLDGRESEGTISVDLPFADPRDVQEPSYGLHDIGMSGRFFGPDEISVVDPSLPRSVRDRVRFEFSRGSTGIFYAGVSLVIEPPVVKRLDSWENLLQVVWDPDLGEAFPMRKNEDLEVGVSLCHCAASRIRSDSDFALSSYDQQVVRWKYDSVNNLEFTQERSLLKLITLGSYWVLGGVVVALGVALLPSATVGLVRIARQAEPAPLRTEPTRLSKSTRQRSNPLPRKKSKKNGKKNGKKNRR